MHFKNFRSKYFGNYSIETIKTAILDMNRSLDKKITEIVNKYQKIKNIKLNSDERAKYRDTIYKYTYNLESSDNNPVLFDIFKNELSEFEIESYFNEAYEYIEIRSNRNEIEKNKILGSLKIRLENLLLSDSSEFHKFKEIIEKNSERKYQLQIIHNNPTGNKEQDFSNITSQIQEQYTNLENYHYLLVVFENADYQFHWDTIAKVAVFSENFRAENGFGLFNRKKKSLINNLYFALKKNDHIENEDMILRYINEFYDNVSYGFQFQDLFISDDCKNKVLVLQKIELDEKTIPCPDCLSTNVRGNSYPKILIKSFECNNPNCISRSKSGRGKRYTYSSIKNSYKRIFEFDKNKIDSESIKKYRKDIFKNSINFVEDFIHLYSYNGDNILYQTNIPKKQLKLINRNILTSNKTNNLKITFENLPIIKLLTKISQNIKFNPQNIPFVSFQHNESTIINGDSTKFLSSIDGEIFDFAVTSPPYLNVREYSQWSNLIEYLIDMMINAKAVFEHMKNDGLYLYNIGDVVDRDNIYVNSLMSKRRQLIGLYSLIIFEIVEWKNAGNYIWNKGEVQSKRNSSLNHISCHLKPINCYEHIWIFKKSHIDSNVIEDIKSFSPVIKINSKGVNTFGHTAPYPLDLVDCLNDFISDKNITILDTFLGSATTSIWAIKNSIKSLGIEINEEYFKLCKDRIMNSN